MLIRLANLHTALLVTIAIVALLFFPAPRGSFVSTHGPVTSMRWLYYSLVLTITMALAAFRRGLLVLFATASLTFAFVTAGRSPWTQASSILRI